MESKSPFDEIFRLEEENEELKDRLIFSEGQVSMACKIIAQFSADYDLCGSCAEAGQCNGEVYCICMWRRKVLEFTNCLVQEQEKADKK